MIDVHSHIIPGVDDGSKTMEHTMVLAYKAYSQGIKTIFATPHSEAFLDNPKNVLDGYHAMKAFLSKFLKDLDIYLGCEILCSEEKMGVILAALDAEQIPSMNETRCVLVEFPSWISKGEIKECVSVLWEKNWIPIIAHVERYKNITGDLNFVADLRKLGCLIQINIYHLEESGDSMIQEWTQNLVLNEFVDFLGTDMHELDLRPPSVEQGLSWLEENCSESYFDSITRSNAVEKLLLHKMK